MWTPIKKISCFIFIILTILLIFYLERIISIYYRKVSNLSLFSISERNQDANISICRFSPAQTHKQSGTKKAPKKTDERSENVKVDWSTRGPRFWPEWWRQPSYVIKTQRNSRSALSRSLELCLWAIRELDDLNQSEHSVWTDLHSVWRWLSDDSQTS